MFGVDVIDLSGRDQVAAAIHHLFHRHDPFAAGPAIGVHLDLALDPAARHPRALGHGLGHVGGVDVSVGRVEQRALQVLGADQRPALLDLSGGQELMLDPDRLGGGGIQHVFVHPRIRLRHAQVAAAGKAGVQPRLGLEARIELDRVIVDMAGRIAHVEQGQQTRRVPGRSGGQLVAFDQQRVPARARQMQRDAASDRAPAHDQNLHMRRHRALLLEPFRL